MILGRSRFVRQSILNLHSFGLGPASRVWDEIAEIANEAIKGITHFSVAQCCRCEKAGV